MQRLHEDDLSGEVLKGVSSNYKLLCFPVEDSPDFLGCINKGKFIMKLVLCVGDTIKIGVESSKVCGLLAGQILTLIEGSFDYDNGLYTETQTAPSVWSEDGNDYDSIYHIFGNNLEDFLDCEIVAKCVF